MLDLGWLTVVGDTTHDVRSAVAFWEVRPWSRPGDRAADAGQERAGLGGGALAPEPGRPVPPALEPTRAMDGPGIDMWSRHCGQRKMFVTMAWPDDTASHFLQVIWSQLPHAGHIPCCGLSASTATRRS